MTAFKPGILAVAIFSAVLGASAAHAVTGSPILVSRSSETYESGRVRTVECSMWLDGVVITRDYDGITMTEEKSIKLTGALDAKIDEVAAAKPTTRKISPIVYSYSKAAYRTNAAGVREEFLLSSVDGVKGEEIQNESRSAEVLRGILNNACNK